MANTPPVYGSQRPDSGTNEFNALSFVIQQALAKLNVATLVQVTGIDIVGGTGPCGTVEVMPLVQQVAGDGTAIPHGTIFEVPYLRIQGGVNAVICDPVIGDIGFCVFADRDISKVMQAKATAMPGSERRFDFADAMYIGGWSSVSPTQYLQFLAGSILLQTPAVNTTTQYEVSGTKVVSARQSNVPQPTGGATIDVQSRTAINSILSLLQAHGLMS